MNSEEIFTDIDYFQKSKAGNLICGDSFMCQQLQEEGRKICVLSDGLGSGIKASILSSLTATMAINYMSRNESILYTAEAIIHALPQDSDKQISYSTFCILDIDCFGYAKIIEYETPIFYLIRQGELIQIPRHPIAIERNDLAGTFLYISEIRLEKEDRIICFSDGVTQSGMGHPDMPEGWKHRIGAYVQELLRQHPFISASELSKKIVIQAEKNDGYSLVDDASCCVAYFRTPRQLLVCTGPPFDKNNDKYLAGRVKDFPGKKLICGGTTAQILARELHLTLYKSELSRTENLPPVSSMEGIDLVTEGILTLNKVERILSSISPDSSFSDPANKIIRLLRESDRIYFLVGTCVNVAHQDPTLPVELEIRRNIVKRIKFLLEKKFFKTVEISYL